MTANVQDAILLFGDSLTERSWSEGYYAGRLADVYRRKLDIVNRGFGGYNTRWAITIFKQLLHPISATQKVRLLVIWLGANDAAIPESPQHIPLADYKANLKTLVAMAREAPCTKDASILLMTPPPVSAAQWRETGYETRKPELTKQYALAVGEVVKELKSEGEKVGLVDTWNPLWNEAGQIEEGLRPLLSDGLHFKPRAYEIVYEALISVITTELPQLHYSKLIETYPPWTDVDHTNPESSLQRRQN